MAIRITPSLLSTGSSLLLCAAPKPPIHSHGRPDLDLRRVTQGRAAYESILGSASRDLNFQLVPLSEAYFDDYYAWITAEDYRRSQPELAPSREEIRERFRSGYYGPDSTKGRYIILSHQDRPSGWITYWKPKRMDAYELGIVIADSSQRGKGIGTEGLRLLISHIFHHFEIQRIQVRIVDNNLRALRMVKKLGFHKEGRLRNTDRVGHEFRDSYILSILKDEWISGKTIVRDARVDVSRSQPTIPHIDSSSVRLRPVSERSTQGGHRSDQENGRFTIVLPNGKPAGSIDYSRERGQWSHELDLLLEQESYQGQAIGSAAIAAALDYLFGAYKMPRIQMRAQADDSRMLRIIRESGLSHEVRLRSALRRNDTWLDIDLFGILRDEWLQS